MTSSPLLSILNDCLDDARGAGARACELTLTRSEGTRIQARGGRITEVQRPCSTKLRGRVYLPDGRSASLSADTGDRSKIAGRIRAALDQARGAAPDAAAGPADRYSITTRGLGIDDVRFGDIGLEDREEVALLNEESCAAEPGVQPRGCTYEDRRTLRAYASSRGVEVESADTLYTVHLEASLGAHTLSHTASARNFANVGSLPYGVDLARRLVALQGSEALPAVSLPDAGLPLVLESRVVAWIIQRLGPAFSSRAIAGGKVFLSKHAGQRIASPKVHLMDDGGLHGGLHTRAFDDRGVPPLALPVIREGIQAGQYYDPEGARAAGVRPTGHAMGGALSPSNLILLAGNRSRTQMLSEVPNSICFDHIDGSLNLRTGKLDVSGPAFLLEKGRRIGVIDAVRLKTDLITLLSSVREIASDQERCGAVDCATALVVGDFPLSA